MTARNALVFINLPVQDVARAIAFFKGLGFDFNPQFTDDSAACLVFSDKGYAMLLSEARFKDFARRAVPAFGAQTSHLIALSAESRADVDWVVDTALASGGSFAAEPMDYGFMYQRSFYCPDGHHWEVLYMDPNHVWAQPEAV